MFGGGYHPATVAQSNSVCYTTPTALSKFYRGLPLVLCFMLGPARMAYVVRPASTFPFSLYFGQKKHVSGTTSTQKCKWKFAVVGIIPPPLPKPIRFAIQRRRHCLNSIAVFVFYVGAGANGVCGSPSLDISIFFAFWRPVFTKRKQ